MLYYLHTGNFSTGTIMQSVWMRDIAAADVIKGSAWGRGVAYPTPRCLQCHLLTFQPPYIILPAQL